MPSLTVPSAVLSFGLQTENIIAGKCLGACYGAVPSDNPTALIGAHQNFKEGANYLRGGLGGQVSFWNTGMF